MDFLLGCVHDPVPGEMEDWLAEHQTRLTMAFHHAQECLLAAAGRRKEDHDQGIRVAPLQEGQLVYLHNHIARGRHKIQDLWNPVVYLVLRAPTGGRPVYIVAPVG